jgi:hypothetical protein
MFLVSVLVSFVLLLDSAFCSFFPVVMLSSTRPDQFLLFSFILEVLGMAGVMLLVVTCLLTPVFSPCRVLVSRL